MLAVCVLLHWQTCAAAERVGKQLRSVQRLGAAHFWSGKSRDRAATVQSQARSGGVGDVQAHKRLCGARLNDTELFVVARLRLHAFTWSQRHWRPADGSFEPDMVYSQEPITHCYPHDAAALLAGVIRM